MISIILKNMPASAIFKITISSRSASEKNIVWSVCTGYVFKMNRTFEFFITYDFPKYKIEKWKAWELEAIKWRNQI